MPQLNTQIRSWQSPLLLDATAFPQIPAAVAQGAKPNYTFRMPGLAQSADGEKGRGRQR